MNYDINSNGDKLKEECGIIGIYSFESRNTVYQALKGLISLQHRGQENAGIAVYKNGVISCVKGNGLINEAIDRQSLNKMKGKIAIGHVRYSTAGERGVENAQPLVSNYRTCHTAIAHNGNITNVAELKANFINKGDKFNLTVDSEVLLKYIDISNKGDIAETLKSMLDEIKGAFSLVIIKDNKLIGVRDKHGFRPLMLGKLKDGYILASETVALDAVQAEFVRDIEAGEIVVIDDSGIKSFDGSGDGKKSTCIFEYIYFSHSDSVLQGKKISEFRKATGIMLAKEKPCRGDMVTSVPESGRIAAKGFAQESGIPYSEVLIKKENYGRTFILRAQDIREETVSEKFHISEDEIRGKRIIVVDDSIVRGTTCRKIVKALRVAGAMEVHLRISSPPIKFCCYFGINTPTKRELLASEFNEDKIREYIGADSLGYLSFESMVGQFVQGSSGMCTACFSGNYPV